MVLKFVCVCVCMCERTNERPRLAGRADSTIGRQGGLVVEVVMLLGVGLVFQAMSFAQIYHVAEYSASANAISLTVIIQGVDYLSLVMLFSPIDNAH